MNIWETWGNWIFLRKLWCFCKNNVYNAWFKWKNIYRGFQTFHFFRVWDQLRKTYYYYLLFSLGRQSCTFLLRNTKFISSKFKTGQVKLSLMIVNLKSQVHWIKISEYKKVSLLFREIRPINTLLIRTNSWQVIPSSNIFLFYLRLFRSQL